MKLKESPVPVENEHADSADNDATPAAIIALRILEALAYAPGDVGVTALAQQLGIAKPRVYRHLSALKDHGYVSQNPATSLYSVSWRFFQLGQQVAHRFSLARVALPIMRDLCKAVGHTVAVSTFSGTDILILDFVRGGVSGLEIGLSRGTRFPLNALAQGKIALAFGPPALAEKIFSAPLAAPTSRTITDPDRLRIEVELAARRGWADGPEELFRGINGVAVPIFSADHTLAGCLTAVDSVDFLPSPPDKALLDALMAARDQISAQLGLQA